MALLTACYRPAYQDCEVECAGNKCPSGLSCDPALHVCRVVGATGPCGQGSADASSDDGGDQDMEPSSFCASYPTAVYCQDFDSAKLGAEGWDTIDAALGSSADLTSSERSAPFALTTVTQSSDGTTDAYADVQRLATLSPTFTATTLALDVNFRQRDTPSQPKTAVKMFINGYAFSLESNGTTQAYFTVNGNPGNLVYVNGLALGVWYRVEMRIVNTGTELVAFAKVDGVPVGVNAGQIGAGIASPSLVGDWSIRIGAYNTSNNGICRFDYDNVVWTVQ
jgi:hypothetical protein